MLIHSPVCIFCSETTPQWIKCSCSPQSAFFMLRLGHCDLFEQTPAPSELFEQNPLPSQLIAHPVTSPHFLCSNWLTMNCLTRNHSPVMTCSPSHEFAFFWIKKERKKKRIAGWGVKPGFSDLQKISRTLPDTFLTVPDGLGSLWKLKKIAL